VSEVNVDTLREASLRREREETPKAWSLSPLKHFHLEQEPWVFVWPELVQTAGDANAGLLLADIVRWMRPADEERLPPRSGRFVDVAGARWLAKTRAAFVMETGLTESQVRGAMKRLRDRGVIERRGRTELLRPRRTFPPPGGRGVKVFARMVHMTGTAARGLVLSQLHYWFSPGRNQRARVTQRYQGEWWWAARYEDIAAQTGLSPRQARTAVERLERRGLIVTTIRRFQGRNTLHLRFHPAAFIAAWNEHFSTWMALQADPRFRGHIEL